MGFLNWLRGDTTRPADDHAISSGYSFSLDRRRLGVR